VTDEPEEVVDGVPVLDEDAEPPRGVEPVRPAGALAPVAVQAVAVVGASMVAGAAAVAIAHRRKARKLERRRSKALPAVLASRSFLVDVHVLGERK
jgi:hypothetical protein